MRVLLPVRGQAGAAAPCGVQQRVRRERRHLAAGHLAEQHIQLAAEAVQRPGALPALRRARPLAGRGLSAAPRAVAPGSLRAARLLARRKTLPFAGPARCLALLRRSGLGALRVKGGDLHGLPLALRSGEVREGGVGESSDLLAVPLLRWRVGCARVRLQLRVGGGGGGGAERPPSQPLADAAVVAVVQEEQPQERVVQQTLGTWGQR